MEKMFSAYNTLNVLNLLYRCIKDVKIILSFRFDYFSAVLLLLGKDCETKTYNTFHD